MNQPENSADRSQRKPPPIQILLLTIFLVVYPAVHLVLNQISPPSPETVDSRITDIYLPAFFLQLLVFASIYLALKINSENLAAIGLRKQDFTFANLAIGLLFLFAAVIILNLLAAVIAQYTDYDPTAIFYVLPQSPVEKIAWVIIAVGAGISEEVCFRGFVITRLNLITGSIWPGLFLGSLSFGISHGYQGGGGVVMISIYGLLFAFLFVARGSLVPCIIAHSLQDILAAFGGQ